MAKVLHHWLRLRDLMLPTGTIGSEFMCRKCGAKVVTKSPMPRTAEPEVWNGKAFRSNEPRPRCVVDTKSPPCNGGSTTAHASAKGR